MEKKFCCQINPNTEYLEKLHKKHNWIPGKNNIRPTEEILIQKENYISNINIFYESEKDFVLTEFFNFKHSINNDGKIYVKNIDVDKKHLFLNNLFPYDVHIGTFHYVLWYSYVDDKVIDEKKINSDINSELTSILKDELYDYVWYENPKKHMKDIYHIQVFWRKI